MSQPSKFAIEVISSEIQGLEALKQDFLDHAQPLEAEFGKIVSLCQKVKGRLIVSGMGKSGHVARKIAATLASTGTRASYVHPGEASHGDLGMISQDDIILALSNSGETPELGDLLSYARRFSIPLIAITAGTNSTLAKAADFLLTLPQAPEACNITNAPTTSTTLMMALGDALAVTILRVKGFTASDFHTYHPGGKLGATLKRVSDLMRTTDLPLCDQTVSIETAVAQISAKGFGCVGITNAQGVLIGIVTDGDLRRYFSQALNEENVTNIMTRDLKTMRPDNLATEALALLSEHKITALFIVDTENKPLGLLHVHDCLDVGVV